MLFDCVSSYFCKPNDTMGIIIGWDNYGHLTTKSNLSPTLWILQVNLERLLDLRDVIINDVHCNLQLSVTWCKVQHSKTESEEMETSFTAAGSAFRDKTYIEII